MFRKYWEKMGFKKLIIHNWGGRVDEHSTSLFHRSMLTDTDNAHLVGFGFSGFYYSNRRHERVNNII